jgi:hypothetical protein
MVYDLVCEEVMNTVDQPNEVSISHRLQDEINEDRSFGAMKERKGAEMKRERERERKDEGK